MKPLTTLYLLLSPASLPVLLLSAVGHIFSRATPFIDKCSICFLIFFFRFFHIFCPLLQYELCDFQRIHLFYMKERGLQEGGGRGVFIEYRQFKALQYVGMNTAISQLDVNAKVCAARNFM